MSREALAAYGQARQDQLQRNEARRIRIRVHEARQSPHVAALRWPFELLQNALDAGPRPGRTAVTVLLQEKDGRAVFEHDGAPFSPEELAALLSGGSSKEFDSEETTGRFGTGFLVTHVLAERTSLEGILAVSAGYEHFRLALDRSGDEEAIFANIQLCSQAIEDATALPNSDGVPSARFEYVIEDESTLTLGLDVFRSALPYLYGTRPSLGQVRILDGATTTEIWTPEEPTQTDLAGGLVVSRMIRMEALGKLVEYRILRVATDEAAKAAALVLLRRFDGGWEIVLPGRHEARLYVQYPLRSSSFLPIEFVFDGGFEPDQERSRALMNESDREALALAFDAGILATSYACSSGFKNAHLLARAASPLSGFATDSSDEIQWWRDELGSFAERLARLPLVSTAEGFLPALADDSDTADFIAPRLVEGDTPDETTVDRMWPLVDATTDLFPPIRELAVDWSETATGWKGLGVALERVTAHVLADRARGDATELTKLLVDGDPVEWISGYIDVVGECWVQRGGIDATILNHLLPNQMGVLRSPSELRRDAGIPEELKDICGSVGLNVRSGLLSTQLVASFSRLTLEFADTALVSAVPTSAGDQDIIQELMERLRSLLPEDSDCSDADEQLQSGTAKFLNYLWRTGGKSAEEVARKVPLVTSTKKVAQWSPERVLMAPVAAWNSVARPFGAAYPADRILDELYMAAEGETIVALSEWGIARPDPITRSTPRELEGRRLAEMVFDQVETTGLTVRGEEFSQIALLPVEVINHIQEVEEARALLGLVLCHVARNDPAWRERRIVKGWRDRESIDVPIRGALWLGDLRSRAWVPVPGEDGKVAKAIAEASTLRPLLDPSWLEGNHDAIALLTECFDFDELDLRLLGIAPEAQGRVRQGLARLLQSGGADPAFYESLADDVEARKRRSRDVERSRRMGYAVQAAVKEALERYRLKVTLVDRGFDYEVMPPASEDALADAAVHFGVGSYFVEVKATSTGPARLTPLQAETATSEGAKYVLCVVDVRGLSDERLDAAWTAADIEPLTSMLGNIGERVVDTRVLVQRARDSTVGIRNESALRYEVPSGVWEAGISIGDWVTTAFGGPKRRGRGPAASQE